MAMTMDMRGPGRSPAAAGERSAAERARAFAIAGRHTPAGAVLRVLLPVAGGRASCLAYALTLADQLEDRLRPARGRPGRADGRRPDHEEPQAISASPRTAAATRCAPSGPCSSFNPKAPIKLIESTATSCRPSNVVTKLKSKHGLLDNTKGELELFDGIEIDASNGMRARMSRAMVYSKEHGRLQAPGRS